MTDQPLRLAYVVKRYPRYSETFIVNEILEHEAAGNDLEIFALRAVRETHFQDILARVKAPVTYIRPLSTATRTLWELMGEAKTALPGFWQAIAEIDQAEESDLMQAIKLAMKARERGITHFHAHFGTLAATVARLASRLSGIPYTLTVHAKDMYHCDVDDEMLRLKLRDAAAVVTVSDYNRSFLVERYGADAAGVVRIYNGLDLDRFAFVEPDLASREILAVGRLVEKKGFDVLIAACALLRDRGTAFTCRIVGQGVLEEQLRARIDALDLGDLVRMEGPRPQGELAGLCHGAALLAAPCIIAADGDRDGLPTVLLEAMAMGTPCVSTAVTGIPELVRDRETGLCVPPNDPEALAVAMEQLLNQKELRLQLARRARNLIETEFDARRNAAQLRRLFTGKGDVA